jgi:hypothetical protein
MSRLPAKVHPARGRGDGVDPICRPADHPSYVGFAHTHLPDSSTGEPYLGFSDRDYRATLADGDNLALVTNGPEVFALVRTADCTVPLQEVDDSEFEGWTELYDEVMGKAQQEMRLAATSRTRGTDALNRALWQVNRELCQRLGFAFYRGLWGAGLRLLFQPGGARSRP